jgi:hypothetical protein
MIINKLRRSKFVTCRFAHAEAQTHREKGIISSMIIYSYHMVDESGVIPKK